MNAHGVSIKKMLALFHRDLHFFHIFLLYKFQECFTGFSFPEPPHNYNAYTWIFGWGLL